MIQRLTLNVLIIKVFSFETFTTELNFQLKFNLLDLRVKFNKSIIKLSLELISYCFLNDIDRAIGIATYDDDIIFIISEHESL